MRERPDQISVMGGLTRTVQFASQLLLADFLRVRHVGVFVLGCFDPGAACEFEEGTMWGDCGWWTTP